MSAEFSGEPLLPLTHAARATGISYSLLRRLVHSGRIPHVRVAGVPRVRLSAVRQAIEERPAAV